MGINLRANLDMRKHHAKRHRIALAVTICIVGVTTKDATIPLHPRLAAELLTVRPQDAKANDPVFPAMKDISHAIRRDIERAGIERIDAMGRKLDFHALRYTFATRLAREGTAQRTAQELMRHSDPKLTAQIYTDASQLPTFDAVKSLSWVDGKGDSADGVSPHIAPLLPDFSGPFQSRHGTVNHCNVSTKPVLDESDSLELAGTVADAKWRPHGDSNPSKTAPQPSIQGDSDSEKVISPHIAPLKNDALCPRLARVVESWKSLPEAFKLAIIAIIDAR